jgi:hypothetical protein
MHRSQNAIGPPENRTCILQTYMHIEMRESDFGEKRHLNKEYVLYQKKNVNRRRIRELPDWVST